MYEKTELHQAILAGCKARKTALKKELTSALATFKDEPSMVNLERVQRVMLMYQANQANIRTLSE